MIIRLNWHQRLLRVTLCGEETWEEEFHFANASCESVAFLVLYNHTGALAARVAAGCQGDFVAYWTDILIL